MVVAGRMNAWWTEYLPEILREWLEGRQQLQKVIGNTGWLMFDRVLRIVIGLTIGAWVARYLGPTQFGELAYVISFIAFFQVIAGLESDGFVVRDIAQDRGETSIVLGTALWLRLLVGLFSWIAAVLFIFILHPEDSQLIVLTAIVGATLVFQASDTVDLWFQSQSQSKRTVAAKLVSYLLSNGVKIILLFLKAPLVAFAGVMCLEGAALALSLVISYRRFPTDNRWRASLTQAKTLLHLCWPFIVSSLMITVFMRIDQLMLKEMMGEQQLGIYAAALPLSQVWTVIPSTLITSLAPYAAQKMRQSEFLYREAMVKIFRLFAILALSSAAITALASSWIIKIMYGAQYEFSAVILSIHVFANLFIFQGIAQDLWIINNNVRAVTMVATFAAAVVGICSNSVMIKYFGSVGAVISFMLATATSVVVIPCLLRKDLFALYKRAFLGISTATS